MIHKSLGWTIFRSAFFATILSACSWVWAAGEVVFAGPGGSIATAYRQGVFPAFEKGTGIKVTYVVGTVLEGLTKVEAQRERPAIDVVTLTDDAYAQFRQKGLFEKLTPQLIPRLTAVYPAIRYEADEGVPHFILTTGIAYNTKIFKEKGFPAPTSINDLWIPAYRNHIVLWTPATTSGVLELLLVAKAAGGNENNVDKAFVRLKELSPYVEFNKADEMTALMQREQAWLGWWNNIRVQQLKASGLPIELAVLKEGTPVYTNGVSLVKNAPNRDNAIKLTNYLLSDEGQTLIAKHIGGGPTVQSVVLPPDLATQVPYGEAVRTGIYVADMNAVVKNRALWLERWAREIER
jgi:putative spermidine/putrescine transport system substrate-binding protein